MQGVDAALQAEQGGGQDRAAAHVRQGQGELVDQVAGSEPDDALDGGDGALPGADDEGEQLHDVGQLGLDAPPTSLDLLAEPPVAAGRAADQGDESRDAEQRHAHVTHHRDEQTGPDRDGEGRDGPQELLEPEPLVAQGAARSRQPAPHRLRR